MILFICIVAACLVYVREKTFMANNVLVFIIIFHLNDFVV